MSHSTLTEVPNTGTDPEFTGYLGELRIAGTRDEAARLTALLSSIAGDISKAIVTAGPIEPADEGTGRDPLAWAEVATQLTRVSLALTFGIFDVPVDDQEAEQDWKRLAQASTRPEFAAAWAPIKEGLTAMTSPVNGETTPRLREFAVAQILTVADAVINARW